MNKLTKRAKEKQVQKPSNNRSGVGFSAAKQYSPSCTLMLLGDEVSAFLTHKETQACTGQQEKALELG